MSGTSLSWPFSFETRSRTGPEEVAAPKFPLLSMLAESRVGVDDGICTGVGPEVD